MLQEAASRHDGQVVAMACGDLVLLCADPGEAAAPASETAAPRALPDLLSRLLRVDAPDPERLVSLWPLPLMAAALLAYATARAIETPPAVAALPAEPPRAARTGIVDALAAAVEAADISDLLRRQTAVFLPPAGAARGALWPLFREVSFSIAALEARIGGSGPACDSSLVSHDPFLFRHLASRLDRRMLELLAAAHGGGGPLDHGAGPWPPLHLNLTLPAIASGAFARFAASRAAPGEGGGRGLGGGIEVSLIEACADPAAFNDARARVHDAGLSLVLDRVSHLALLLTQVWPLQPDLLKLEWTPLLASLDPGDSRRLDGSLARLGPARLLLLRADSEAAVRWGLARGIRRFQGRHVDAMLAASRLAGCAHAGGCTLRQCTERGEASGEAGRRFCRNTRLLDEAAPAPLAFTPLASRPLASRPLAFGPPAFGVEQRVREVA